ncbi:cell wall-active antibiotics response protein LiaF [Sporolactobacillus putidus]|uniref:Cell wall-active antibiotics response LiaF-like C-terminal domain-containing protein n=1 Tax=Sporolactobacillus putidus TaxID=492735 RepID=A0A917S8S1_9BACL|nr:cell wall-active antibiotics response protein LiaF [Sporolactobacillus putidus]GGL64828.1 hypothetical protein GCM10007968_31040 [Sporolactobacillus putidus]
MSIRLFYYIQIAGNLRKADDILMFAPFKTDKYSWILITGLFLIVIQTSFGGWGFLFPCILFGVMIHYGNKRRKTGKGKFLFWFGVIGLVFTALNLIVLKFIIIALFIIFIIHFIQSKKHPKRIIPGFNEKSDNDGSTGVEAVPVLLKNKWFGNQETPHQNYEWQDINIQTGAGDTLIDLSHTILPKRESVIFIRHFAGRVRILVPYGVEVALRYSVVAGQADFFDHREPRLINESIAFQTNGYDQAEQKVKVIVSAIAGNLEVRRI